VTSDRSSDALTARLQETASRAPEFVGLPLQQARGLADRLELELPVTTPQAARVHLDLRPKRITVHLEGDVVLTARAG